MGPVCAAQQRGSYVQRCCRHGCTEQGCRDCRGVVKILRIGAGQSLLCSHSLHLLRSYQPWCRHRASLEKWIYWFRHAVHVRAPFVPFINILNLSSFLMLRIYHLMYFIHSSLNIFSPLIFSLAVSLLFTFIFAQYPVHASLAWEGP